MSTLSLYSGAVGTLRGGGRDKAKAVKQDRLVFIGTYGEPTNAANALSSFAPMPD